MRNRILANNYLIARGNTNCETALSGVSALPASASYIDVSGYEYVHILAHLGTLHTSDTPVFTPKCADSASGTLDVIDSTLAKTPDPDADDGQVLAWSIKTDTLPSDHHFLSLAVSGTLTNGSYADVVFLLEPRHMPVTQTAAVCPSDNQFSWVS